MLAAVFQEEYSVCILNCEIFTSLRDVKQSLYYYYVLCVYNNIPQFSTNFRALYLTEFLTDFGQILDSKSYDQV